MSATQGRYTVELQVPTTPEEKLYEAAKKGDLIKFKELCEQANPLTLKNKPDFNLPIHEAASFDQVNIIKEILRRDQNNEMLNAKNKFGHTPLHLAARYSRIKTIDFLITEGADPNEKDENGSTVLHLAIEMQCKFSCENLLVKDGVDLQTKNMNGNTLLHTAAGNGLEDVCKKLIKKKVNIAEVNKDNEHAMFAVLRKLKGDNARRMLCSLYECIAPEDKEKILKKKNAKGLTVLDVAQEYANKEAVKYLKQLLASVDVGILSRHGCTRLDQVKLFVCGSENVGKSTLINSLKKHDALLFRTHNHGSKHKTPWIDTQTCDLPDAGRFSVWEFARQPELYSLFMDVSNAVTLVVYKVVPDERQQSTSISLSPAGVLPISPINSIMECLRFIKAAIDPTQPLSQKPTVILVGTHFDETSSNREYVVKLAEIIVKSIKEKLKDHLNILDEVIAMDAREPYVNESNGMNLLRETLKKQRNSLLKRQANIPSECLKIVDYLATCSLSAQKSFPVKTWSQYVQFVKAEIIPDIEDDLLNKITGYLLNTGEICGLNVPRIQAADAVRESYIVLSPQWLCYQVFGPLLAHDGFSCLNSRGTYSKDQIHAVFQDNVDDVDKLIKLLVNLDLCYEIKTSTDGQKQIEVVIPCKLLSDMPQDVWKVAVESTTRVVSFGRRISCKDTDIDAFPKTFFPKVQTSLAKYQKKTRGGLLLWRDGLKGSIDGVDFIIQMTPILQAVHIVVQFTLDGTYCFKMSHQMCLEKCHRVLLRLTQHVEFMKDRTCPGTETVVDFLSSKCLQGCRDPCDIKQAYSIYELLKAEKDHQGLVSKYEIQDHVDQILIPGSSHQVLEELQMDSDVKWIPTDILAAVAAKLDEPLEDMHDYRAFAAAIGLEQECKSLKGNCESITIALLNEWCKKKDGKSTIRHLKEILEKKPILEGLSKDRGDVGQILNKIFPVAPVPKRKHIEINPDAFHVPIEVLARGTEAYDAYIDAIQEGSKCIYQTRLMLVGPERVGKTSLTKALTEQEFDANEGITDGIDIALSCTLSVKHTTNWKPKPKPTEGEISDARQQYLRAVSESMAVNIMQKEHEKQPEFQTIQSSVKDEIKKFPSGELTKDITNSRNTSPDASKQSHEQITSHVDMDAPMRAPSREDSPSPTAPDVPGKSRKIQNKTVWPATKPDVPEEVVQLLEQLLEKEMQWEIEWLEETDDDLTLSIWDFAGQDLYYITHQVFLVSRAIYIICFNLVHDLNKLAKVEGYMLKSGKISVSKHYMTNLDFIIFWLRSIYSNTKENPSVNPEQLSPPVFIVGTHKYSLLGNAEDREILVEEKFTTIRLALSGTPYEAHVVSEYYAIDNSRRSPLDKSIVDLRDHITKVAKQQPYMGESIPLKWLNVLHEIEQLCNNQKHSINFKEVKELAAKCGVIKEVQLFTLLQFYHDLGNIIYYGKCDTPDSPLNDIIILNSNWLICIFKRVFTVKAQSQQWATLRSSWKRLDEEGLLEEKLIRHLWHDLLDQLEGLLQLMQKFDFLCVKTQSAEMPAEEGNRLFYVPSLLKKQGDEMVCMDQLKKSKSVVILYIDFKGFLPEGLFYRLLVRLVQWSQSRGGKPVLFYQQAELYVDEHHDMTLRILPQMRSYIQVAIMRASSVGSDEDEEDEAEPCPVICNEVLTLLEENLLYLGHTWMKRIDFGFCVLCTACNNKEMTDFHELKKCLDKKLVPCGRKRRKRMDTTRFQRLFGDWKIKQATQSTTTKGEDGPSASARSALISTDLSLEDFLQLLEDVSSWWKRHGNVNMLKVLLSEFKDMISLTQIEEKDKAFDLFGLLRGPGLISPSNVDVVIEAAVLGGLRGVQRIVKEKVPTFPGLSNIVIRRFSEHRRNLIKFGQIIGKNQKESIGHLYDLTSDQLTDQWVLIFELEKKGVLTAERKQSFIQKLVDNGMNQEADALK